MWNGAGEWDGEPVAVRLDDWSDFRRRYPGQVVRSEWLEGDLMPVVYTEEEVVRSKE
jgi:hypothetical protein